MKWEHIKECCKHLYRKTVDVENLPWGFSHHKWLQKNYGRGPEGVDRPVVIGQKALTYIYFRVGKYAWATWYWREL